MGLAWEEPVDAGEPVEPDPDWQYDWDRDTEALDHEDDA